MKRLIPILAAAVMLVSCSDSEANNYKDDSFSKEPKKISELYEGYEELLDARYDQVDIYEYIYTKAAEIR